MRKALVSSLILLMSVTMAFAAGSPAETSRYRRNLVATGSNTVNVYRVMGAVGRPGVYALKGSITVPDALRKAGGAAPNADFSRARVRREKDGNVSSFVVDARGASYRGSSIPAPEVSIQPGDTIAVPLRTHGTTDLVTKYFSNMPLIEAIESILAETSYGYSIDSSVVQGSLKVTASLKNTPVESALNRICGAAGATCGVRSGFFCIASGLSRSNGFVAGGNVKSTERGMATGSSDGTAEEQCIDLKYVQAGDILPILSQIEGVKGISNAGSSRITITAPSGAMGEALKTVERLDNADAYPKPLRIVLVANVTVGDQHYTFATESRTAAGTPVPLSLNADRIDLGGGRFGTMTLEVQPSQILLRPPVDGKDITITGNGYIKCVLPMSFDRRFTFAVCLASGTEDVKDQSGSVVGTRFVDQPVIASGSVNAGGTNVSFEVMIGACVETGRIANQAKGFGMSEGQDEGADRARAKATEALGRTTMAQGKLEDAAKCFREALRLDPRNGGAHNGLGLVLLRQGRIDEAIDELSKAVSLTREPLAWSAYQDDLNKAVQQRGVPAGR